MTNRLAKAVKPNLIDVAIECLEDFEFCYKLSQEQTNTYSKEGYLFPSLRPWNGEYSLVSGRLKQTVTIPGVHTLGLKITNKRNSLIGSYFFARFQVASKELHEPDKPIFANVFRLQRHNNLATVWFTTAQDEIDIVIQGIPRSFLELTVKDLLHFLCGTKWRHSLKSHFNAFQALNLNLHISVLSVCFHLETSKWLAFHNPLSRVHFLTIWEIKKVVFVHMDTELRFEKTPPLITWS